MNDVFKRSFNIYHSNYFPLYATTPAISSNFLLVIKEQTVYITCASRFDKIVFPLFPRRHVYRTHPLLRCWLIRM